MKIIDSNLPPPIENPSWFRRILMRLAKPIWQYETMSGNGACPVYLERWTMLEVFGCGMYLHHFIGDDWASDPHDHPRRFISIGLKGWYWEDTFEVAKTVDWDHPKTAEALFGGMPAYKPVCRLKQTVRHTAPWIRSFPAEHLHRVRASECGDCWTLVIVLRKSRPWGFVRDGLWMPFKEYVFGNNGGNHRRSC